MSTVNTRKKTGRPRVDSEEVSVRLQRPLLDRLDAYRETEPDQPGRPEAIRRILEEKLK